MTKMIKRVALALNAALGPVMVPPERVEIALSDRRNLILKMAQTAIATMREPTEAMVNAAMDFGWQPSPPNIGYDDAWRAMIDAALSETS